MPTFSVVGNELMKRYDSAARIRRTASRALNIIERVTRNSKPSNDKDTLVFLNKSPNFCRSSREANGSKRMCNQSDANSTQLVDNAKCEHLCCGRGFHAQVIEIEEDCDCQFQWCCMVKCKKCKKKVVQYFCN